MNLRSITDRAFYSEWAILRYSPEPKFWRISMPRKLQVAAAVALAVVFTTPPGRAQRADAETGLSTASAALACNVVLDDMSRQQTALAVNCRLYE